MYNWLLDIVSIGAIISAIIVITSNNPIISVLFLISVFINVAGYLILIGIGFIGISYIIVYVGAIAILFLFVIIIINLKLAELTEIGKQYTQNLPLAGIITTIFIIIFIKIIPISIYATAYKSEGIPIIINIFNINNKIYINNYIQPATKQIYNIFNNNVADKKFGNNFIEIQSIGEILYTNNIICVLICGIILLLAIVGPINLTVNNKLLIQYNYNTIMTQ